MKYVFYAILIYIAYQFIFKLVIPVFMASRKIKQGFREMHEKMQEQVRKEQGFTPQPTPPKTDSRVSKDDYIEFEEVK